MLVAVNAFGDVVDPQTGEIIAGLRSGKVGPLHIGKKGYFADTLTMMKGSIGRGILGVGYMCEKPSSELLRPMQN